MALKFSNNGTSTLASSITSSQTTLTLQAGTGVRLPTLAAGDYFMATIVDTAGNMEIVRVTARSADTLTATRGQEGTLARAFDAGSYIANHLTAGQLATFFNTDNDGAGSGLDADLLDGLQHQATNVPSSIVSRDSNGDFAARVMIAQTFSGDLSGNASTATTATNVSGGTASVTSLTNTGTSNLQGNVTLGVNTANIHTVNGGINSNGAITTAVSGVRGIVNVAIGGVGLDAYGAVSVTAPSDGAIRRYFSMTRSQQATHGIGIDTSNRFVIGAGPQDVIVPVLAISGDGIFSRVIPGGSTLYPDFACRAWVNFNGTGAVAIRGSGNVSSITDNGVGDYTVNFTNAMPDANYSVSGTAGFVTAQTALLGVLVNETRQTTSSVRIVTSSNSGATDTSNSAISIFR